MIRRAPCQIAEMLFKGWSASFDMMWTPSGGVTPADRITALGPTAAELFPANAALVQFMLAVIGDKDPEMPVRIQPRVALIPAFTVNEDGSVTLD